MKNTENGGFFHGNRSCFIWFTSATNVPLLAPSHVAATCPGTTAGAVKVTPDTRAKVASDGWIRMTTSSTPGKSSGAHEIRKGNIEHDFHVDES